MENIIIYTQGEDSSLKALIEQDHDFHVRVQNINEIKQVEKFNPAVIIIDCPEDVIKNTTSCNILPVPTLLVTDKLIEGLFIKAEAYDYIFKPVNEKELNIRLKALLKIKQLREDIKRVSTTDELTGLYNRKYLHERMDAELSRAKRYGNQVSCMLLDIDFFKTVNDMYGYDWGDVLLREVTEILKKHVRKEDVLTRYGDEEFIIMLPDTDEESAYVFAERLRRDIERMQFLPAGEEDPHPITISGGISCYPYLENTDEDANTLVRYAEHALYNAKKRGKNKIVLFSQINMEF